MKKKRIQNLNNPNATYINNVLMRDKTLISLTDITMHPRPAWFTDALEPVDLVFTFSLHTWVRLTLINVCNHKSIKYV